MSLARNILPAVYSGMNRTVQYGGESSEIPVQKGGRRAGGAGGGPPIVEHDKKLLNLQAQADQKKQQIKEDYKHLKTSVKENPYLAEALTHYDQYFALQQKQINALKALLKDSALKKDDQKLIVKEIATLEKNLP